MSISQEELDYRAVQNHLEMMKRHGADLRVRHIATDIVKFKTYETFMSMPSHVVDHARMEYVKYIEQYPLK